MTPREILEDLQRDIFMGEDHGCDWKVLSDEDKARIKATALHLMLEGWKK